MDRRCLSLPGMLERLLPPDSDRVLLDRFAASGDEAAFAALVDRYGSMVLGLCRRALGDADHADDVLQATFLVLARKAGSIRRRDSLAGWLCGVGTRLARQTRRSEAARCRRERRAAANRQEASTGDPAWEELLRVLDEELQRLPDRQRAPLLLCFLEGRTQDEAAKQLDWSLSTLRRRLEEGREVLRGRLSRRGLALGAGLLASFVAAPVRAALRVEMRTALVGLARGNTAALSPAVLQLAQGELRMRLITKIGLGLVLLAALTTAAAAWMGQSGAANPAVIPPALPQTGAGENQGGPPKKPAPGHDLFNDPLPAGALARLGTVAFRHGAWGSELHFSPDGKSLVSLGGGWVRRWDLATGKALISVGSGWKASLVENTALATADGKTAYLCRLAILDNKFDGECSEYDLETGKARRVFQLDLPGPISRTALPHWLSPDGQWCAGVSKDVLVWKLPAGTLAHQFKLPDGRFTTLAFAPDNKTLFVGDDVHTIHVLDFATGKELRTFGIANVKGISALALSPDGKYLATAAPGEEILRVWDTARGTVARTLDFPERGRTVLFVFSSDSKTLLASTRGGKPVTRGMIRSWDVGSGKQLQAWTDEPALGLGMSVSPDSKVLATINDAGVIRFWDMATGKEQRSQEASPAAVEAVSFEPDGKRLLTVGADHVLRSWDAATGRLLPKPRMQVEGQLIQITPEGQLLTLDRTGKNVHLVDPAGNRPLLELPGRSGVVSADGKLLATSGPDGQVRIFNLPGGTLVQSWQLPKGIGSQAPYPAVKGFSADGQTLVLQGDVVSVWNIATAKELMSWSLLRNKVTDANPKAGGSKGKKPSPTARKLLTAAVSPDGTRIAFGLWHERPAPGGVGGRAVRSGVLMVLEVATGKLFQQTENDDETAFAQLVFSPDSKRLAAGGWRKVLVWDVGADKAAWQFEGHRGQVQALAFSPDGKRLASGSDDSTVLIWDLTR